MNKLWTALTQAIYPKACLICQEEGEWLCSKCQKKKIKYLNSNSCPFCGKLNQDGRTCKNCQKEHPYLEGLISTTYLNKDLKKLIYKYKYYQAREISKLLAKLVIKKLEQSQILSTSNVTLAPIPLHPLDRARRGFNQAQLIAKEIAKINKLNYQPRLLVKTTRTKDQTKLTREERKKNIRNAFKLNQKPKNRLILLVDDVFTTGSTLEEVARTINKEEKKRVVWGVVVARR